jgi:hypothetical protein
VGVFCLVACGLSQCFFIRFASLAANQRNLLRSRSLPRLVVGRCFVRVVHKGCDEQGGKKGAKVVQEDDEGEGSEDGSGEDGSEDDEDAAAAAAFLAKGKKGLSGPVPAAKVSVIRLSVLPRT